MLWIFFSLKTNDTKCLLIFDDSCEEVCNSQVFAENAITGRHRGLNNSYANHNLFLQSNFGRDVELQKGQIVLFKTPSDVMQVSNLSAQLGLGLELVKWNRDATSLHYGLLVTDSAQRKDDQPGYCTITAFIPSKKYISERLNHSKFLNNEHTKFSTLQVLKVFFRKCKIFFLHLVQKEFIQFLRESIKNLVKGNLQSLKRQHVTKFQNTVPFLSKTDHLEAKQNTFRSQKKATAHKICFSSRQWPFGLKCSCLFLFLLLCTTVWKLRQIKNRNFHIIRLNKVPRAKLIGLKRKKQKTVGKADSWANKSLTSPPIKL